MAYHKSVLFLLIIFVVNSFNLASALNSEGIVDGELVKKRTLKYHVAILTRKNYSWKHALICSGGIIAYNLVLTAAQCFFNPAGEFIQETYSVAAATVNLNHKNGIIIDVDLIHIYEYHLATDVSDIAVLKLKEAFILYKSITLKALKIPKINESFDHKIAKISGYGYNWASNLLDPGADEYGAAWGSSDLALRSIDVQIIDIAQCKANYHFIEPKRQMCGVKLTNDSFTGGGICTGDAGNPVVVNDTLVGIVSLNPTDCDDTFTGAIYTRVSAYVPFIHGVLLEKPVSNSQVFLNPTHMPM